MREQARDQSRPPEAGEQLKERRRAESKVSTLSMTITGVPIRRGFRRAARAGGRRQGVAVNYPMAIA